ncbi:MAG: heavy-metal-associated domain-containing protein [Sphingomonadaceae bacterium]|jgi:hypothetical protein
MTVFSHLFRPRGLRFGPAAQLLTVLGGSLAIALGIAGLDRAGAQIEGERGIAPVATSTDIHVTGIEVDVTGKDGVEAREKGWEEATRKAWAKINGPKMGDGQLSGMVQAIVIEEEKIGPRRYIATLGVIFDRTKAASYVGSAGGSLARARSAPMLVVPVLYSGGVRQVFEVRGPWQAAWANFQAAGSRIAYARPIGAGGESLVLNAGQTGRRSRLWWRNVLNSFEAADVVIPVARLERTYPGGPVNGTFTARYGPDNEFLDSFTLTAKSDAEVPRMMADAVIRIDKIYQDALARGVLTPDPTLMAEERAFDAALAKLREALSPKQAAAPAAATTTTKSNDDSSEPTPQPTQAAVQSFTVQFSSPDAAAVDAALGAVRGAPGVSGAATTSLAIGGTSVMRVSFAGDANALAAALRGRGWSVSVSGNTVSMTR